MRKTRGGPPYRLRLWCDSVRTWLRLTPLALALVGSGACSEGQATYDARDPAAGPGVLAGQETPLHDLGARPFAGGDDRLPAPLPVTPPLGPEPPSCDAACRAHCDAAALVNPVNRGLCTSLWGVGLDTRPIDPTEACRRLFADVLGRFPTRTELSTRCLGRSWTDTVSDLLASDEFVRVNQRRWADRLLYNNEALSPVRIYDADRLVGKLYRGLAPYDQFAMVISAHPVLTRRYATASDRAEAFFRLFVGRPPYERERADLARLYVLWDNDYYEHPSFGRVPDAFIRYRCVDDDGRRDPSQAGQCASVLWGYRELVFERDVRARTSDGLLWSGLLTAEEWSRLEEPGRIVAGEAAFWERAVDDVLDQYLGYRLSTTVPQVRENLVDYLLANDADLRAVHFAVLTSAVYLQSTRWPASATAESAELAAGTFRYTWGPLKQAEVEAWIDTVEAATTSDFGSCDPRLPDPWRLLDRGTIGGYALVEASGWTFEPDSAELDERYMELARSLGGCPENLAGGRFKTVSILTTATQEGFITRLCNPALLEDRDAAPIGALLPDAMPAQRQLTADVASAILDHQVATFFAREPSVEERLAVSDAADACTPKPCTAEAFARPLCFALMSTAEMLFY